MNKRNLKLLYVGRVFKWKNPVNIIHAVARTGGVQLLCIGNGSAWPKIQALAKKIGSRRIRLVNGMPNRGVLCEMRKADAMILNTYYHEWSKVMIEAMLLGRPIIVNKEVASKVPELSASGQCSFCSDTIIGYRKAILRFQSKALRRRLARVALLRARALADPKMQSKKHADAILDLKEQITS